MSDYKKIAYQIRCLQRAVCNISQNGGAGISEILMTTSDEVELQSLQDINLQLTQLMEVYI